MTETALTAPAAHDIVTDITTLTDSPDDANGNSIANTGAIKIVLETATLTATPTISFVSQQTVNPGGASSVLTVADVEETLVSDQKYIFGPFSKGVFNDAAGNLIIEWTGDMTGITLQAIS